MAIQNLLVSISGGLTSGYMAYKLNKKHQYNPNVRIINVYANTGEENEETLEFLDNISKNFKFPIVWVEALINQQYRRGTSFKIVDFKSASRNGEPFEEMIKKYGIPNMSFPHCSRVLKKEAITAYGNFIFGRGNYYTAIGIRYDEFDRMAVDATARKIIYPLIINKKQKSDILKFWSNQDFTLKLEDFEGNCKVCWKKSLAKLIKIAKKNPEKFKNFANWEHLYGAYRPINQPNRPLPANFYRQQMTTQDILKLAELDDIDLNNSIYTQSSGCESSCNGFD